MPLAAPVMIDTLLDKSMCRSPYEEAPNKHTFRLAFHLSGIW